MSFPFVKKIKDKEVTDLLFVNEIAKIEKAILEEKYKDNCYAEPKPTADAMEKLRKGIHQRKKKLVNRRT